MDDLDFSSSRLIEEIQQGLRTLDEEEENLMMLRGQLTKVKKFREEQARKDEIIQTLQHRISSLEYEQEFARKQHAELTDIMTERIATLEKSLAERDETEKEFAAYQVQAEMIAMDRDSIKTDLEAEMRSHDQSRMENSELTNEIHKLHVVIQQEKQSAVNSAVLFEALRVELQKKEQQLQDHNRKSNESIKQLSHGLSISRKAVEDMAEKLIRVEEDKSSLEVSVQKLSKDLNAAKQEAVSHQNEVTRWSGMYAELEKVLSTLKAQSTMAQQGYNRDLKHLQEELTARNSELDAARLDLAAQLSTLTSLAGDMASIAATKAPTSLCQLHHHRTEVIATIRSLKRFVSKLKEPSLLTELYRKMVHFAEEISIRMLTYHEGLLELSQSSSEETKRAMGLEQSSSALVRDLGYADTAVEQLIRQFQTAGFLYMVDTSDLRAAIAHRGGVRSESLGSEYRSKLYEEVQLGAAAALRKITEQEAELEEWKRRDAELRVEMKNCVDSSRAMKERYTAEIDHLHRMNEEALIAVRVAEYESGTEVNRLKEEYRMNFQRETKGVAEQVMDLQEKVASMAGKYKQTSLCMMQLLRHVEEQEEAIMHMRSAYCNLKTLYCSAEKIVCGVDSLAQCCRQRRDSNPGGGNGRHGKPDAFVFEPFLDPLEEVPMAKARERVTFRVAAFHVLAAIRMRRLMREGRRYRASARLPVTAGEVLGEDDFLGTDFQLPALYQLSDASPSQVTDMLRMAFREQQQIQLLRVASSPGGSSDNLKSAHRTQLREDMSMDEFDAYLRNYNTSTKGSPSGAIGGKSSASRKPRSSKSLLQALNYITTTVAASDRFVNSTRHMRDGGVLQKKGIALLYRTFVDMSSESVHDKNELEQLQTIISSLEDKVRSLDKIISRQDNALAAARALEEQLRSQIAQLEHDRRSKSWHILNEIQRELHGERETIDSTKRYASKYAPQQSSYEGSFYSDIQAKASSHNTTSTFPNKFPEDNDRSDSMRFEESYSHDVNSAMADISMMSIPTPLPSTPKPEQSVPFTETPIPHSSNLVDGMPAETEDLTPLRGLRQSFQDTYQYDPETPSILSRDPLINLNSRDARPSPTFDWNFDGEGTVSIHSNYSGTDTSTGRTSAVMPLSKSYVASRTERRSTTSNYHSGGHDDVNRECSDLSLGPTDHEFNSETVRRSVSFLQSAQRNAVRCSTISPTRIEEISNRHEPANAPNRSQTNRSSPTPSTGTTSVSNVRNSHHHAADPALDQHNNTVSDMFADIGRLTGKLESRLKKHGKEGSPDNAQTQPLQKSYGRQTFHHK